MSAPETARPARASRSVAAVGLSRAKIELLQFYREKESMIFIFAFPVVMMVIFASAFGNSSNFIEIKGAGISAAQYYVTSMIATGVMLTSFQAMAISIAIERDDETLKMLRGTPMPPMAYFVGKVGQVLVTTVVQIVLLLALARVAYSVPLPATAELWFRLAWLIALGSAAGTALGIAFSSVPRTGRTASAVVTPVVLILQFISGVYFPYGQLPSWMHAIASVFPLKWMAQGMRSVFLPDWFVSQEPGGSFHLATGAAVLGVWLVVGLLFATRTFRWVNERRA
jgi:ABC-2 type transport system permease protein